MTNGQRVIFAPMSGQMMALDQVPDEVFAGKVLGDGAAILPSDGRLCSPVDGVVSTVAETLHAYGFTSDDGLEILVHVGLDTVELKGEGFQCLVREGDRVKAGDPVAEIDLDRLSARGLSTITPVVITDGAADRQLIPSSGVVRAGQDAAIILQEPAASASATVQPATQRRIHFDLLQKLGKVLMTVIAVMPAAGLMLSIGKLIQMTGANVPVFLTIGATMEQIGWAIIGNLHILFAAAIGGSWAKERAGGAFAAIIAFVLINCITGSVFGVTGDMLATEGAVVQGLFGQELLVENYFTEVLGRPALNMGVFIGIISGFIGGIVYNRFYNFRRLPDALAFFNASALCR